MLVLALPACATRNPVVPVAGPMQDVASLAGDWDGTYASPVTGRVGTIAFTLSSGGDSAFGAVTMIPNGLRQPLVPWRGQNSATAPVKSAEFLTIRFVRVAAGRVSGALTPYADPETGAAARTHFEGRVAGDTVSGTFTTRFEGASVAGPTGTWQVVRRRS
ncbi:MAG: hypothetical protein ACREOE_06025, partial [Gemmatimonadales bacterium]